MAFIPLYDTNPLRRIRWPWVSWCFITLNVVVYFFFENGSFTTEPMNASATDFGLVPAYFNLAIGHPINLTSVPDLLTLITYSFLHADFWHLAGNLIFLWVFGDNVEDALGPARYLLFYFLVGTVGALAQCFAMPSSTAPMIGASGAVAGALAAYVMLYPRARIDTLVMIPLLWPVIKVRAWVYLGLWFVGQFLLEAGSGVAWMAHVGGFIAGAGLVRILAPRPAARAVEVEYIPPPGRR